MNPANFPEATQYLGKPRDMEAEDCGALPICYASIELPSGESAPTVITCWEPTDEERDAIAAGGKVYLHVLGRNMPPVLLATQIEAVTVGTN